MKLLLLLSFWFANFHRQRVALTSLICTTRQVCTGHQDGVYEHGHSVASQIQQLHRDFCGCKMIAGSINVAMSNKQPDHETVVLSEANFTFFNDIIEVTGYISISNLPPIKSLSFPSLRLIRGREKRFDLYSLVLLQARYVKLHMPKLVEISSGGVLVQADSTPSTPFLCNILAVNWMDIVASSSFIDISSPPIATSCEDEDIPNCNAVACRSGHCWCDHSSEQCCQSLSRVGCPCGEGVRCVTPSNISVCCHEDCAAGCFGVHKNECHACKHFSSNGSCVMSCEAESVTTPNNTARATPTLLTAGTQCIEPPCPNGLFRLDDHCIGVCPGGFLPIGSECIRCSGICRKECQAGILTSTSLAATNNWLSSLVNCTIITNSLHIGALPNGFMLDKLNVLQSIEEIRGTLSIEQWSQGPFDYLTNLKKVGSDPSEIASQLSQCETVVTPYALSVSANPNLTSLSLPSLCEIGRGLLLVNNPNLCLSLDMLFLITNSSSDMCVTWNGHKDNRRCGETETKMSACSNLLTPSSTIQLSTMPTPAVIQPAHNVHNQSSTKQPTHSATNVVTNNSSSVDYAVGAVLLVAVLLTAALVLSAVIHKIYRMKQQRQRDTPVDCEPQNTQCSNTTGGFDSSEEPQYSNPHYFEHQPTSLPPIKISESNQTTSRSSIYQPLSPITSDYDSVYTTAEKLKRLKNMFPVERHENTYAEVVPVRVRSEKEGATQ